MKNKKTSAMLLISGFAIISAMIFPWQAGAQEEDPTENLVVATTAITDTKIVSQNGNEIVISFTLSNEEKVQPDIRYSAALFRKENNQRISVDEKVFGDITSLGEGQRERKEITYSAPSYLKGNFELWLFAENTSGVMLSLVPAGNVTLNGSGQYIEIVPESCYLTVEEEKSRKRYELLQGVDISSDENPVLSCQIINHFGKTVETSPSFVTYLRTQFGEEVSAVGGFSDKMSFGANIRKTISMRLPKASAPQAYDVSLALLENGKTISNKILLHYVLQGASATIQNIRLDKDYYQAGETAKITYGWSPSADTFTGARKAGGTVLDSAKAEISVTSGGQPCGNAFSGNVGDGERINVAEIAIINECINPQVSVLVKKSDGGILAQKDFEVMSRNLPAEKIESKAVKAITFFSVATLLLIIGIMLYRKNNKKNHHRKKVSAAAKAILVLGLGCAGFLLAAPASEAAQSQSIDLGDSLDIAASLDKAEYFPNQPIKVSLALTDHRCKNHSTRTVSTNWYFDPDSGWGSSGRPISASGTNSLATSGLGRVFDTIETTIPANAPGGNYKFHLPMYVDSRYDGEIVLTFSVLATNVSAQISAAPTSSSINGNIALTLLANTDVQDTLTGQRPDYSMEWWMDSQESGGVRSGLGTKQRVDCPGGSPALNDSSLKYACQKGVNVSYSAAGSHYPFLKVTRLDTQKTATAFTSITVTTPKKTTYLPPTVDLVVNNDDDDNLAVSPRSNINRVWTTSGVVDHCNNSWNSNTAVSGNDSTAAPLSGSIVYTITCVGPGGQGIDIVNVTINASGGGRPIDDSDDDYSYYYDPSLTAIPSTGNSPLTSTLVATLGNSAEGLETVYWFDTDGDGVRDQQVVTSSDQASVVGVYTAPQGTSKTYTVNVWVYNPWFSTDELASAAIIVTNPVAPPPETYSCSRCSTTYSYTWADFQSTLADCSGGIVDGTLAYSQRCSCGTKSGGDPYGYTSSCEVSLPSCTPADTGWGACSKPCGGGQQSRTRTFSDCTAQTNTQDCNTQSCGSNFIEVAP